MLLSEWSKSEVKYGRRLLNSGLEGGRVGREAFLKGRPVSPFFRESFRAALTPAAVGACAAAVTSCATNGRSIGRTLISGILGGFIGLSLGMLWENRFLVTTSAAATLDGIGKVRDEHWLERNPIDYA